MPSHSANVDHRSVDHERCFPGAGDTSHASPEKHGCATEGTDDIDDDDAVIVVDCGSSHCRAGFAGEDAPRVVFPTVVGRPRSANRAVTGLFDSRDSFIGDEAQQKRGALTLKYPIENGIVQNFEDMEKVWHHTFYSKLRVTPQEHPVLLTEPPMNPKANSVRMARIMFETFEVPALYFALQPVLCLYSSGRTTGIIVDSGDGMSRAVPIYEGYALPHAMYRSDLGGRDVTEELIRHLKLENGLALVSPSEREIVHSMKKEHAYVALDCNSEKVTKKMYELPDGTILTLGSIRFRCPEVLFQPSLSGKEAPGLHEMTFKCIMTCDNGMRKDLYENVVLAGGNTMFPGFCERLQQDLSLLAPSTMRVRVLAPIDRHLSTWVGGSILSSMSAFKRVLISKREYNTVGPSCIWNCF